MKRWPKFEYVVPQRLKIKQTILEVKLRFQLLAYLMDAFMRLAKLSKKLMMYAAVTLGDKKPSANNFGNFETRQLLAEPTKAC